MKKSKLLLALAVSAMLINSAYASEMKNQKVNEIEAEDPITNPKVAEYKVKKIYEEGVDIVDVNNEADVYNVPKSYFKGMDLKEGKIFTLYTNREILESDPAKFGKVYKVIEGKESHVTSDIYVIKTINEEGVDLYLKSNPDDLYNVPKKEFKNIDLVEGKEVEIVADDVLYASYPAKFTKIHKISEVKPKEEKVVRDFVVKEINEEGVTLYEVGNESNLYNVPKSEFKDMKVEKGKVFTITSDNISLKSYPAQFGKIFSIVEKKMPAKTMVKSYVVEKVADDMVTVHEKDNKESKYNIAKKDFGKAMPKVGETYKIETSEEILTSDPAQFAAVYKVELEKEAPKKAEKPADKKKPAEKAKENKKENKKESEKTLSDIFVVEKIDQEGVTVYRKSNKEDKYLVPKKDFGKLEIKEGKEYKIFTDDIVLTSYPAQFGKIYKIEEVMAGKNKNPAKNPKTGLIGTSLALVGLIGASIGYKKIK
ncbi:hypothetical protein [Anaerococcus degeneri]|uniref:Uncharacterized protein n=1 Tax=Anaerococcus degeneri TaxID=361500 RepID=A0ABS7YZS8_9FIRM|nr:hypothetical protein [Anaerococcus degeneri]MBP2014756.1 hypothetical protein [Anaerococcus degeneri]MCA2096965.1 hypothetical protein [Anaerococcus degeneri]